MFPASAWGSVDPHAAVSTLVRVVEG